VNPRRAVVVGLLALLGAMAPFLAPPAGAGVSGLTLSATTGCQVNGSLFIAWRLTNNLTEPITVVQATFVQDDAPQNVLFLDPIGPGDADTANAVFVNGREPGSATLTVEYITEGGVEGTAQGTVQWDGTCTCFVPGPVAPPGCFPLDPTTTSTTADPPSTATSAPPPPPTVRPAAVAPRFTG
jgi:hypothetical protein